MKFKKILLLYKQSTYKHLFHNRKKVLHPQLPSRLLSKRFLSTHQTHYNTLSKVEAFLKARQVTYHKLLRGRRTDFSQFDFIITVGGDGTFLEAASQVKRQLMFGINSDPQWSVGRFCSATARNFEDILASILDNQYRIKELNRMDISFQNHPQILTVLNDILICHRNPAAMSRYFIQFRQAKEEQRSSGIWVATAAGSTGAIRSAGGKTLNDQSRHLQFVVREIYPGNGINPLLQKSVFDESDHLRITSLMKEGIVYVDGSHIFYPFPFGEKLKIRNSRYPVRLVLA